MHTLPPSSFRSFALAVAMLTGSACSGFRPSSHPSARAAAEGRVITAADIQRSGAKNAWDALRRSGTHLLIRQSSRDGDARITHRGASSLLLSNAVIVVVDGTKMADWSYLREIPAETIRTMQVLSGSEATLQYGTPAGTGAVVVRTGVPTL